MRITLQESSKVIDDGYHNDISKDLAVIEALDALTNHLGYESAYAMAENGGPDERAIFVTEDP